MDWSPRVEPTKKETLILKRLTHVYVRCLRFCDESDMFCSTKRFRRRWRGCIGRPGRGKILSRRR